MLDIVIVNWNSGDFLRRCVKSMPGNPGYHLIRSVIIVDNDSSDGSLDDLPSDDKIRVVRNPDNYGFAKACNQGFHLCTSPYVLLLNPDAYLLPDTLDVCMRMMESRKNIDILGCRLKNDDGSVMFSCCRLPSPLRIFFDASGLSKILPGIFHPATIMTDWNHASDKDVEVVMGAFMFMRRSLFQKVGFFDERFFVYFEEVDFSKRVTDAGGIIHYTIQTSAVHTGEGTTKSVKAFRLFLSLNSRLIYARKHFSKSGFLLVWASTFLIEPVARTMLLLFRLDFRSITGVWKGYGLFFRKRRQ